MRQDSHGKALVRYVAELELGTAYGPTRDVRLVAATDDPTTLKADSTWFMATNVTSAEADVAEVYRPYSLRDCTNSIDCHCHGGSDPMERLLLEDDIGIDYTEAGMRVMNIKTWYTPSASRNAPVQRGGTASPV